MFKAFTISLRRVRAFVARDYQLAVSYRVEFFMRILTILLVVTTFYFVSKIFAGSATDFSQWRDPLAAWITGLAVLNYFMTGFSSLANAIRNEQMQGTLESVLLALVFLFLTTLVLACLGILSASFAIVFKRGDPFAILLGTGSALFSGVF